VVIRTVSSRKVMASVFSQSDVMIIDYLE